MRARPPMLLITTTAVLTMSVAGCEARVYGAPPAASQTPRISHDTSLVQAMIPPDWSLRAPSSSDDDAAETFWNERGGETIIAEVARRYGLTSTAPPSDGHCKTMFPGGRI